jgi:hypothetical protein
VLYSKRLAKELEQDFERNLAHCTEFDVTEYRNRNAAVRFRDSVRGSSLRCCEKTTVRRTAALLSGVQRQGDRAEAALLLGE